MNTNTIFSAGIQGGHYLAVDQTHWLDNIHFQEELTLGTHKMLINVAFKEISTVENVTTQWALFYRPELTWAQLLYAVGAELQLAKVKRVKRLWRTERTVYSVHFISVPSTLSKRENA